MPTTKTKRLTKTVDSKGRITLGAKFADRTVLLTPVSDTEVLVTLAQVIPDREAWLYKNRKALDSVRRGLEQAKARQFSKHPPNLTALAKFAESIPGE
jgi:DNA-binding transcriptional regulator/RsmH inhibitor MraZ